VLLREIVNFFFCNEARNILVDCSSIYLFLAQSLLYPWFVLLSMDFHLLVVFNAYTQQLISIENSFFTHIQMDDLVNSCA